MYGKSYIRNIATNVTYWAWNNQIWLWIKIAAENIVTMTFQSLQTFALHFKKRKQKVNEMQKLNSTI